ncbi:MAG TPA: hypothetical protein ENJ23_00805, partial [Bacteroidetes bacterium]|nr:hypothetical protein [Bacteroidota bacterium]
MIENSQKTYFSPELKKLRGRRPLLVFDVDGVLLDTSRSFPLAIVRAVANYGRLVLNSPLPEPDLETVAAFKTVPGFNNDWVLCEALLLFVLQKQVLETPLELGEFLRQLSRFGSGRRACARFLELLSESEGDRLRRLYRPQTVAKLAMEHYTGSENVAELYGVKPKAGIRSGTVRTERVLVDRNLLAELPDPLGIYTGRNPGELRLALELIGFDGWDARLLSCDNGMTPTKPDPQPLIGMIRLVKAGAVIFAGDAFDDFQTVQNLHSVVPDLPAVFVQVRADFSFPVFGGSSVVQDVNELLRF